MRRIVSITLLVGSLVGLISCGLFFILTILPAYNEYLVSGDSAALGLGRFYLLYWFLPLAISGLSLASLLWPWEAASSRRYVLGIACFIGAGLSIAQAAFGYTSILQFPWRWNPRSGLDLVVGRDSILFLPLLLLALLLIGNAINLLRRRTSRA